MSDQTREIATQLRSMIDAAKKAGANVAWLSRFPKNCCNFTSNLLLIELADAGVGSLRRMIGTVCDERGDELETHVWVTAGDCVVDITADIYGQPPVIAETSSSWHEALSEVKPFIERIDLPEGVSEEQLQRLRDLYQEDIATLSEFRQSSTP